MSKLTAADHKAIAKEVVKLQLEKKVLEEQKNNYRRFVSEINDKDTFEKIMNEYENMNDLSDSWVLKMYPVLIERTIVLKAEYKRLLEEIIDVPTFEQYLRFQEECNEPNIIVE